MIKVQNLTKKFEGFLALNNITCTIPEGSIYGLIGSNGAGKSTFLRLITGVYKADGGTVLIDDEPVWENESAKKKFIYVSDELYFLPGASMERMAQLYESIYKNFDYACYRNLAKKLNLNVFTNIANFSKGMKRQAAIILGIAARPKYIFFDETFDGLDPVVRTTIKSIIYEEVAERGATAIITSHSLRELEDTCDQLSLLHKGGLVFEKELSELKTSLFKVQIALEGEYDSATFENLEIINFSKKGSVANIIIRGTKEDTVKKLKEYNPIVLDILPLSLEEVFTYEMSALGYYFKEGGVL